MKECIKSLEHIKCSYWVNIGSCTLFDHTRFLHLFKSSQDELYCHNHTGTVKLQNRQRCTENAQCISISKISRLDRINRSSANF